MTTRILELEEKLMNHNGVHEVATKMETINKSKIKIILAFKSIDRSVDASDHDIE